MVGCNNNQHVSLYKSNKQQLLQKRRWVIRSVAEETLIPEEPDVNASTTTSASFYFRLSSDVLAMFFQFHNNWSIILSIRRWITGMILEEEEGEYGKRGFASLPNFSSHQSQILRLSQAPSGLFVVRKWQSKCIESRFGTPEEDAYRRDLTINRYCGSHIWGNSDAFTSKGDIFG